MTQIGADVTHTATYVLLRRKPAPAEAELPRPPAAGLPADLLVRNAIWFCWLRWLTVFVLASLVAPGVAADLIKGRIVSGGGAVTLVMVGILTLYNIAFHLHAAALRSRPRPGAVRWNLWGQIMLDLVMLTAFVHFLGSLETFVPFAYLFHIALASMVFSRRQSMAVALMACGLYAACVFAELVGLVSGQGYLATHSVPEHFSSSPLTAVSNFAFATLILMLMWYLTSEQSGKLRRRDLELEETNRRLEAALGERARHMLRTAKELKTPLSAIHANMQLLLKGYMGELSDPAREVVNRAYNRCERLAHEMSEMLELGNLRSESEQGPEPRKVDLSEVLMASLGDLAPAIQQRRAVIDADLRHAVVTTVEGHMRMLFSGLLSNAVTYSRPGGKVHVRCEPGVDGGPKVTIEDEGLGIPAEKLPHIFEEYYRTDEAVLHNPQSSGLGLTVVQLVAEKHGIEVKVTSRVGRGTKFELQFPE
ncbi:MAG: HAMP domain-containing sensor histidine kinase [Planctomycetota bacterium]|nr:HAMP domain-containing sensor histidine kinase [Planctomycetota bacterium]